MKATTIAISIIISMLTGCGAWARHEAASSLEESNTAYKQCLAQAGDASKCAAQKQAYEADLETYEVMRGKRLKTGN
jgi:hypothetical protein